MGFPSLLVSLLSWSPYCPGLPTVLVSLLHSITRAETLVSPRPLSSQLCCPRLERRKVVGGRKTVTKPSLGDPSFVSPLGIPPPQRSCEDIGRGTGVSARGTLSYSRQPIISTIFSLFNLSTLQ